MSKRTTMLALAAVSAVMFVLPAAASANWGVTPGNMVFHGTTTGGTMSAAGEPSVTCGGPNHITGAWDGSGTTGSWSADLTECHTFILGITRRCTTGPEPKTENTITTGGTFHNVTITGGKRGVLITMNTYTLKCQSALHPFKVSGSIIGEVTQPVGACPLGPFTDATLTFSAISGVQADKKIDGSSTEYFTTVETEGTGTNREAFEEGSGEGQATESVTIDCNEP